MSRNVPCAVKRRTAKCHLPRFMPIQDLVPLLKFTRYFSRFRDWSPLSQRSGSNFFGSGNKDSFSESESANLSIMRCPISSFSEVCRPLRFRCFLDMHQNFFEIRRKHSQNCLISFSELWHNLLKCYHSFLRIVTSSSRNPVTVFLES